MIPLRVLDVLPKSGKLWPAIAVLPLFLLVTGRPALQAQPPQAMLRERANSERGPIDQPQNGKYHPGRILVRFKPNASFAQLETVHAHFGAKVLRSPDIVKGLQVLQLAEGTSVQDAIRYYRSNPNVLYAEPDYIVHAVTVPNDPQFSAQWNLQNTGQNGGTPGADIRAVQAWALSTGSTNVVVGVIDTGVDYNHQDLAANIWTATSAFTGTNENGVVTQCPAGAHGFSFVSVSCDPMDDNGHGTHVSGTIGAVGNNGIGVVGINWQVQLLPCKFLDATGAGDTGSAIACLNLMKELKDSGVNIIATNNSWGGPDSSQALHDAIASAMQDGMLFIAAAGNDFSNNDQFPTYPANFQLPNVISVAATDRNDAVATFSNLGRRTVHIGAPGLDILSTLPNNTYGYDSGTSMAAPHVTGLAALLKSQNPSLDWRGIRNLILAGGDTVPSLQETITQKRLNAYGSMTCTNSSVASRLLPVADTITGSVGSPVTLSFLNIRCAQPAGSVTVLVTPGNQSVVFADDGTGADLAANDGIYTAQWTPSQSGSYSLTFPDGSTVAVQVLSAYGYTQTSYNYRSFTGTGLNLGDDSVAAVTSPFSITFGGGSFTNLYVSSNGTISFTDPYDGYQNFWLTPGNLPSSGIVPLTMVAPFWMDLYPVKGANENVFWEVTGAAPKRELVVEWRNVRAFACRSDASASVTFQVVFKEGSSDVLFNYSNVVFGGACSNLDYGQYAIAGIMPSPTEGVMWSNGSGPGFKNGLAVLWQSPPPVGSANPVPTLSSISPSSAPLFTPDLTITLTGTNFVPGSIVQWRNMNVAPEPAPSNLPTNYVSATQLTAILPAQFMAPYNRYDIGTVQALGVFNPSPAGGSSTPIPFSVLYPGVPTISSLTPSSAAAEDFSFYMDVKGNNLWGAQIYWNGQNLFTLQLSNGEAYAGVPSSLLATAQVTAVANVPGGGTSSPVPFKIGPAAAIAAGAASAPALQEAGHQTADSSGSTKTAAKMRQPVRFLGWNYGKTQGPAYLKYFSRPYGEVLPAPSQPLSATRARTGTVRASASNPQLSLSQPAGLPGFAFHPTLPTGFLPTSVTTGDFNRDGKMDWVVSNGGTNDLWIYFGNGDGTAQLPRIIRLTGAAPVQVVAADLRKIGVLDLVVAEADSQSVGILLGNGDGTFQPEVTYYIQGPPLTVAVGDVNGDGKLDVVAGLLGDDTTGPLVTLLGDSTGKFGKPVLTPFFDGNGSFATTTVVLKDMNGDGLADAVVLDQGGSIPGAHSYLSTGDGTFKHADFFFGSDGQIQVTNVAVADLDGDGCQDAVTTEALGVVRVFKGTCDGGFQGFPNVATFGGGEAAVNIALADMNGDGNLDVVTSGGYFGVGPGFGEEASNLVTVLLGDGKGNLGIPKVYRIEPSIYGLALADLNGDGKPEVIAASQDTDKVAVLVNEGKGNLDGPTGGYVGYIKQGQQGSVNAPYSNFMVQDLNGDGKPDLAFVATEQYYSTPWEFVTMINDGTGHFGAPNGAPMADFGTPPAGYVLGDFRNSGRPDLVVSSSGYQGKTNTDLAFLPNNGDGSFGKARVQILDASQIAGLGLIAAGDFNKDGKLDLVGPAYILQAGSSTQGSLQLLTLLGNGDGTFRIGPSVPFGAITGTGAMRMIFVGDYNRDGNLDVLVWCYDNQVGVQNHNVYEFLGNGDGSFAAPKLILPNFGFFGMADLNHDGYPDIVEFNQLATGANSGLDAPSFTIYIGQPDGTFQQGQTYSSYSGSVYPGYGFSNVGPNQILTPMLADFNGDGNIDIGVMMLTPYPNAKSYMQVLAGNGDGTFTPTYEVISIDKFGMPTNAADLNGDGRADLIELDGWPSSFHVILGVPGPTVQLGFTSQPIVGTKGSVTVNLSLVPATSTVVQLSASDPNIQIAPTVTIPAGSLSATVPFTLGAAFDSSKVFSLSAQLSGQTSTIYSYQAPNALVGVHLFAYTTSQLAPPNGTTQDYGVGVISVGGYSTTVQFSCQGLPAGATCLFGSNPLPVAAGQAIGSSLTIQVAGSTPVGAYTFTLVATDGAVSDQMKLVLNVADFTVSVTPASATLLTGATANFSLQLNALGNWTGLINVSCNLTGPVNLGCAAAGSRFVGSSQFSVPTSSIPPGDYTMNVSGAADGVTHTAAPTVIHLQGVTGLLAPSTATVSVGGSATFNLTLNSQNGYTDQFTFSCPGLPTGVSCSFKPASGSLPANSSLASLLTVNVSSRPALVVKMTTPEHTRPGLFAWVTSILALLFVLAQLVRKTALPLERRCEPVFGASKLALALFVCVIAAACGGGSGGTIQPPPPPPQPVFVTITVQATSSTLSATVGTATIQVN